MKSEPVTKDKLTDDLSFEVGQRYDRSDLHDVYGGQRYTGIATPADYPMVMLFTGDAGEAYGYEDRFTPDGTFLYTGEGVEGDMTFDRGNAAIRDHEQNGDRLFLFENTDDAWIVTFLGEYE